MLGSASSFISQSDRLREWVKERKKKGEGQTKHMLNQGTSLTLFSFSSFLAEVSDMLLSFFLRRGRGKEKREREGEEGRKGTAEARLTPPFPLFPPRHLFPGNPYQHSHGSTNDSLTKEGARNVRERGSEEEEEFDLQLNSNLPSSFPLPPFLLLSSFTSSRPFVLD